MKILSTSRLQKIWQWLRTPPHAYVVALIIIGVVSHLQWFNPLNILQYADWQYRPDEHVRELVSAWNSWVGFNGLGKVNILMSGFPFRGLGWGLITRLGFTYDIATKLTLFIPIALGSFLLPFLLGKRLFKNNMVAFITALFYGSTAYLLIIETAHLPIALVYALIPLLVYLLDRALDENRWRDWLWLSLLFCVGVWYEVRMMYVVAILLALYFAYFAFTRRVHIKYYLKYIAGATAIVGLANVFWLLPTKFAAAESIGEVAGRGLFGDSLFNLLQSLTVMRWNWTGSMPDNSFTAQPIPPYLWLVPLIIGVSLVVAGQLRRRMVFFLAVTVIGLLLTKQSAEPFASLYHWLYLHFPGFMLFREASKFYVLVAFGYFGLLGYGLLALRVRRQKIGKWRPALGYAAAAGMLLLVIGGNLRPAITTDIGGVFKPSHMPEDYTILKRFLAAQPDYFRTYWAPRESWWGFYDNQHPVVRAVDVLEQEWRPLLDTLGTGHGYDLARANIAIFQQSYANQLFDNAAIKYVIVPLRDKGNQEDFFAFYGDDRQYYIDALDAVPFLKRVNIGTKEVAVYENKDFRPYIAATDKVFAIPDGEVLTNQMTLGNRFAKDISTLDNPTAYDASRAGNGQIVPLFDPATAGLVSGGRLTQKHTLPTGTTLYVNQSTRAVSYDMQGNALRLWDGQSGQLKVNGQSLIGDDTEETLLGRAQLTPDGEYYMTSGIQATALQPKNGEVRDLGRMATDLSIIEADSRNLITNPSFEQGLWQQQVGDCNNYKDNAVIGMVLNKELAIDGKNSLELGTRRHTACTHAVPVTVEAGNSYLLAFDYQNDGGQKAGYKLWFNDSNHTALKEELATGEEGDWHHIARRIDVPKGASRLQLEIYGYPDHDHYYNSLTRYDNFRLSPADTLLYVPAPKAEGVHAVQLPAGEAEFTFEDPLFNLKNLIPHASFEDGLWQKEVGDCNDYDDSPNIGMTTSRQAFDGRQSLQLEAGAHMACTTPGKIAVHENQLYVLSFAYQSRDATNASYFLQFDDPAQTTQRRSLPIKSNDWQRFAQAITVPPGARHLSLTVYAAPNSYSDKRVGVRYDNFSLVEVPNVLHTYYALTEPKTPVVTPASVRYDIVGPTKKLVHVQAAKGPFYLVMSEGYHTGWRLQLQNSKVTGPLDSWSPLGRADAVAARDHLELNIFQNGWYVDPAALCKTSGCTKNSDGSYNLEMSIEFVPQRWFVAGSLVSGVTLAGVVTWLGIEHHRRRALRMRKEKA